MSRSDHLDPELLAELDAIDATLAGEPVDPSHAELAELALLLADSAPQPRPEFTRELDVRVRRRFAPLATSRGTAVLPHAKRRRWQLAGLGGAVAVAAAAAVAVAIVLVTQPNGNPVNGSSGLRHTPPAVNSTYGVAGGAVSGGALTGSGSSTSSGAAGGGSADLMAVPAPSGGGRRIQSAQISLTTPNAHIDQVSQEVFGVVAQEGGSVKNSQITTASGSNGGSYASFTLSIPTGNLQAAMTRLSELDHTAVSSRTDSSQNVSDRYSTDQRKIADAQALRISLLRQLQNADTTTAIESLQKQIRDVEAKITRDQTALKSLQHRISFSSVSVDVNAGRLPGPLPLHNSHGFTLHRALHDAVHVLVVAAGVALIALAVAIPVALIVALLTWLTLRLRRRGRERALDQA